MTAAAKPNKELVPVNPEPDARRSSRTTKAPVAAEKKKRWTRDEIATEKAEVEKNQQCLKELSGETDWRLVQMDIDEDIQRHKEAEGTILQISDIKNNMSDPDGEEFVGYEAVSSSSDDDDCGEEAEDSLEEVHSQSSFFILH